MSTPKVKSWTYSTPDYPETLKFQKTSVPPTPETHHVLVETKASGLNPVDIQLMNFPLNFLPGFNGPKVPGRDFAGVVIAAAPGTGFRKGDGVMGVSMSLDGSGALTEVAHIDTRSSCLIKKPGHMSWVQAASLPLVWLTACTAIEKCAPFLKEGSESEKRVAVLGGSSAVGMYAIRIARERGWKVLASCSERNADFVRARGADEVVDYTSSPGAVTSAVSSFEPDAIIDCVGGTDCIGLATQFVTVVGDKTSRASLGGSILYLWYPRMLFRWLVGYLGLGNSYECIVLEQNKEWLERCTTLDGDDIVIDSTFEFEKAKEAYERVNTGRARGKVVVEFKD